MSWYYRTLATEVYEPDKPAGRSFGAVEYYTRQLTGAAVEPMTRTTVLCVFVLTQPQGVAGRGN